MYETRYQTGYETRYQTGYQTGHETGYETRYQTGYETRYQTGHETRYMYMYIHCMRLQKVITAQKAYENVTDMGLVTYQPFVSHCIHR